MTRLRNALILEIDQDRAPGTRSENNFVCEVSRTIYRLHPDASLPIGSKKRSLEGARPDCSVPGGYEQASHLPAETELDASGA